MAERAGAGDVLQQRGAVGEVDLRRYDGDLITVVDDDRVPPVTERLGGGTQVSVLEHRPGDDPDAAVIPDEGGQR